MSSMQHIMLFHIIGKSLIACQTAVDDFRSIVEVVGGPNEKERAR